MTRGRDQADAAGNGGGRPHQTGPRVRQRWHRTATRVGVAVAMTACWLGRATPAAAQVDPLLFLKNTKPNVLLVVDVANRMQRDADNAYLDQYTYPRTGAAWEDTLGLSSANMAAGYRRKYVDLAHRDMSLGTDKFSAQAIVAVGDLAPGYATFEAKTRLSVARAGLVRAIQQNLGVARFGLIKMRQLNPLPGPAFNEGPVFVADADQQWPTDLVTGRWKITRPTVDGVNGQNTATVAPLVKADVASANLDALTILARTPTQAGALNPAGRDGIGILDAPVEYMLIDAKAEASRLIAADVGGCRNTVVVLVVGGSEGTTAASQNPAGRASEFLNLSGRRVPVYVIAIAPRASDNLAQLQAIAANSGGQYIEITKAMIDAVTPGQPVPEVVRAVNTAVQHTFAACSDFNASPTALLPYGPSTEIQVTSPIVGTVNLENARDINGASLPDTVVTYPVSGNAIPQRSNVMVTSGFALPGSINSAGFPGRLRAFRVYRPAADSSKAAGYKFVSDGTPLWVAATPAAASRNIYTTLADGTMVAFTTANAGTLASYLGVADAASLITYVRGLPLGAVIDSTPAILDPPSLDPPPDPEYPGFAQGAKNRRSLLFVGANDGMLHAIDGRLGTEVWAFIPFNLLPKLRALREGQAVDQFQYFLDGSPKLADVKVGGEWRSYLVIGQGPGGTFYQTLDVTMADMASSVTPTDDSVDNVLAYFSDPGRITLKWAFPRYTAFDWRIAPYGDVSSTCDVCVAQATDAEKTVGQTWSDPAVGQVQGAAGRFVVLTGSGFFGNTRQRQANRFPSPSARSVGTTFYMLDVASGALLDSRDVGNDGLGEAVDSCATAGDCTRIKNALQADPVATGPPDSRFITQAYIGDLDGQLWRFGIGLNNSGVPTITNTTLKAIYSAGAAHPLFSSLAVVTVGSTNQYIFVGTGSDLLPSTGVSQSYKLLGILDSGGASASPAFSIDLTTTDGAAGDEKVTAFPAVAGDIVFFTTTTYYPATPCAAPDTTLYALTFAGGAAYDSNGDGSVSKTESPKVKTLAGAGRATAPFVVDQHLAMGVGGKIELFGDPQDFNNGVGQTSVRTLSWRERR